jgi:protein-disulfide isomerase
MIRSLLLTTTLSLSLLAGGGDAQTPSLTEDQWGEIRTFLETNPGITQQLMSLMSRPDPAEQAERDAQAIAANQSALFENPKTPILGNPDAPQVIVKFSDYSCGHCKTMHGTLNTIRAENDTVQVRIIEFPILGERSELAARFALAAHTLGGNEAYGAAHDALFKAGALNASALRTMASDIGLDPTLTLATMLDDAITQQIQDNLSLGETLGINGTPGLVVGTAIVRGSVPKETMELALDQAYPDPQTP